MFEPPPDEIERCPACGTTRTFGRVQCSCGYSFESGFVEPLPIEDGPVRDKSYVKSARRGEGSLVLGIVLGFCCACLPALVAGPIGLGRETVRGVWIGFAVSMLLTIAGNIARLA